MHFFDENDAMNLGDAASDDSMTDGDDAGMGDDGDDDADDAGMGDGDDEE